MTITIHQLHNLEGKHVPLCAFDAAHGYYGHTFQAVGATTAAVDGFSQSIPIILCTRCGALWTQSA